MRLRTSLIGWGAFVLLASPASAGAATKTVQMGLPPSGQKQFEKFASDANAFFPTTVSVRVGESVRFVPVGFHTVDLPARGGKPLAFIVPTGKKAAATDAAGAPFHFNGAPLLGNNPALFATAFGKTLRYDGTKARNSGLPLARKPKPVTISFAKTGTFTYYCDIHPGMKGTVRVVAKGGRVPSGAADHKAAAAQLTAAVTTARALATKPVPAGVVRVGQSGAGGVERFAFAPAKLTVDTGTTVTFAMPKASREAHTATTGPGDPEKDTGSYLGKLATSFQGPAPDPIAVYASDRPSGGAAALTPQLHGNGLWNSGVMDADAASPLPSSNRVRFAAPGTYEFYCLIHPFMHATITAK